MTVTLPDSLRDEIGFLANLAGHDSVDRYVEAILRREHDRVRKEIDAKLIEGLESGDPIEVNEEYWSERRRVLAMNIAKGRGAGSD